MWEAIRDNHRRSWLLVSVMFGILAVLGFALGGAFAGDDGVWWGVVGATVLWAILLVLALAGGDDLILMTSGAREVAREDAPQLWNVVEEMSIASGLGGKMPRVFIVEDTMPNAFAVGRRREHAAVAVTSGLLARLDRDELQGVVAHEIGHIVNRDVSFMVMCSVMLGSIVILSEILLRVIVYGGGRRRGSSKGGGHPAVLIGGLVLAALAPILAQAIYFACSRRREYLADASAARFTRYPQGLASALEKISAQHASSREPSRALAPLYIVNPLRGMKAASLFATHPPIEKRVAILRRMAGAGYKDYDVAYRGVVGGKERMIGARTLARQGESVGVREPTATPDAAKDPIGRAHDAAEIVGRLAGLVTMHCACGVWIKVPQGSKRALVPCPRCGRDNVVPGVARPAETSPASVPAGAEHGPLQYQRRTNGWESFRCDCGRTVQLSPGLATSRVRCRGCGREIALVASA